MSIKSSARFLMELNNVIKGLFVFASLILISSFILLFLLLKGAFSEKILKWMFKSTIIAAAAELVLSIVYTIFYVKSKQMDTSSLSVRKILLLSILMMAIVAFEFGICFIGAAVPHM